MVFPQRCEALDCSSANDYNEYQSYSFLEINPKGILTDLKDDRIFKSLQQFQEMSHDKNTFLGYGVTMG